MPNESGDLKILESFRRLIDLVAAEPGYNPSNAALKVAALNPQYAAARAAALDVPDKLAANMAVRTAREAAFDQVNPRMTRIHGVAKASGGSKPQILDLTSFKKKLIAPKKKKAAPAATPAVGAAAAADKEHSTAQLSYANIVGHLRGYFGVLGTIVGYNPNEADLKLPALLTWVDDLQAKNDAVTSSYVPLSQARGLRDQLLYQADNSIVNHALLVKEYVKGAFGTQSQLYKQVKGLEFKRRKK